MDFKIAKQGQFIDGNGKQHFRYKIFYMGRGFWLSSSEFANYPGYIVAEDDKISLREPLGQFFAVKIQENINGKFNVLIPKPINIQTPDNSELVNSTDVISAKESPELKVDVSSLEHVFRKPTKKEIDEINALKSEQSENFEENVIKEPEVLYQISENEIKISPLSLVFKTEKTVSPQAKIAKEKNVGQQFPGKVKSIDKKSKVSDNTDKNTNKLSFVNNLLDYSVKKKVDHKTRERLFSLIGREVENSSMSKEEVEKIIDEKIAGLVKKDGPSKITKRDKIHNPEKVVNWLKLFTKEESHIKYSTHLWDDNKYSSYELFITGLMKEYKEERLKDLENYNYNLFWEKIYPFLFQNKLTAIQISGEKPYGWGRHKIKIGWQFPDVLKEWCSLFFDNKSVGGKKPMEIELPQELLPETRINGKTIKYFEDVVNLFKEEIEFRNNNLYIEVMTLVKQELSLFKINSEELETLKGRSFYTNTEYVIKAISRILKLIKSYPENNQVSIKAFTTMDEKNLILEIFQLNSFSLKELNHPKIKLEDNSGDLSILRTTLWSLCDFSIESRFRDEKNNIVSALIEYLYEGVDENNRQPRITIIDKVADGFKYILKFPL